MNHFCRVLPLLLGLLVWATTLSAESPVEVRVGFFANLTHSQALIGLKRGNFQQALGSSWKVKPIVFNAGPSVIEAIFAGQIDLAYIGPNPAVNGYVKSRGAALVILAGATTGGASLVLRPQVAARFPSLLGGLRLASPQLGNTQDVALRSFLQSKGYQVVEKGGTVDVIPMENASILTSLAKGEIDGAWVAEPWASRLVDELKAVRVLDERSIWPEGKFSTAVVIVSKKFLTRYPKAVEAWLRAHRDVTLWEKANPDEAMKLVNQQLKELGGRSLSDPVLKEAWSRMTPDLDPQAGAMRKAALDAAALGYLREVPEMTKVIDRRILDKILAEKP